MTAPTEALPLVPPPAGSWVRARWLPNTIRRAAPRIAPEWNGSWHVATGDVRVWPHLRGDAQARSLCGKRVGLRWHRWDGEPIGDHVVADELPTIDVCLTCLRLSKAAATVHIQPRLVTVEPA